MDVTLCNLSPDITVKDFKVLFNGVVQAVASFTKNSQTQITYTGGSIASTTVVVQRNTPIARVAELEYRTRISTVNWEAEFNRLHRVLNEYEINGAGSTAIPTFGNPSDAAFSAAWDGDTAQTATRNALYDHFITRAPLVSPTFTGTVTVPDNTDVAGNANAANTRYVDTRVTNALTNSPALGGTPTAPNAGAAVNTNQVATTAHVKSHLAASPALGGTPTAPTAAKGTNSTQVATTAHVADNNKPMWRLWKNNAQNGLVAAQQLVTWSNTDITVGSPAITSTRITIPAGGAGYYFVHAALQIQSSNATPAYAGAHIWVNGVSVASSFMTSGGGVIQTVHVEMLVYLLAGNYVEIAANGDAGNPANILHSSWFQGFRLTT